MAPLGAPLRGEAGRGLGRPDAIRPRRAVAGHVPRFSIPARCSTAQTRNEACIMTITRVTIAALVALLAAPRPAAGQAGDGSHALGLGATRPSPPAPAAPPPAGPPAAAPRRRAPGTPPPPPPRPPPAR